MKWFKKGPGSFTLISILVLIGPIIWAIHFIALNLTHSLVCVSLSRDAPTLIPIIIGLATLLAAAPILLFLLWPRLLARWHGDSGAFLRATLKLLLVLSLVAVVWSGMSAFMMPAC
jgi:hypothetical protein